MDELISIVVPVYNLSQYLRRSIESILCQTYGKLEVIAVDDGSTDGSLALLEELATEDGRVRVIHQENGGVTKARLTGAAAAYGEWIGFVDGDDYVEPDMYERLLRNAKQYGAEISHCGFQMVFPSHVDYYHNTGRLIHQDQETGVKDLLEGAFIEPCLCNKLFHKNLFHSLLYDNVMNLSVKQMEDLLMNFFLFREAKSAAYEDVCPYHYVLREGSACTSALNESQLRDNLLVWKILREQTSGDERLQRTVNARLASCLIGLATTPRGEQEALVKPYRENARKELRAMLPALLGGEYSARTKLLSAWAALSPGSYSAVHRGYSKLRGTDKKYEVK